MRVKICGITEEAGRDAAVEAGAAYLGFVFFARSPRNLSVDRARALALDVKPGVAKVALTVNADDAQLDEIFAAVPIDMIQLHGEESPARVAEVRSRYGLPVMKAIGIRERADLDAIRDYTGVADQLLIDAKPPKGAPLPGGNGLAFDWSLLAGRRWATPWMLAGGLTPQNAAEAVRRTGAQQLDLSSGVESAPGVKDPAKIREFMAMASAPQL